MDNLTFDNLCDALRARENFGFARYGDGEWAAILHDQGCNCDGHPYYDDMGLALSMTLLREQVNYMGMQPKATNDLGDRIAFWKEFHGCEIEWCDADIIHDASIAGRLNELAGALEGRKKILVAPKHLKKWAAYNKMIYVPTPDGYPAWKGWTTMYSDMTEQLDKDTVVLYCASMSSEVMIDKASREYGDSITQIDVGSAFDPLVGVCSRRYHRKLIEEQGNGRQD